MKQAMDATMKLSCFVVFILLGATVFSLTFQAVDGSVWVEHLLTGLPGGQVGFLIVVNLMVFLLAFVERLLQGLGGVVRLFLVPFLAFGLVLVGRVGLVLVLLFGGRFEVRRRARRFWKPWKRSGCRRPTWPSAPAKPSRPSTRSCKARRLSHQRPLCSSSACSASRRGSGITESSGIVSSWPKRGNANDCRHTSAGSSRRLLSPCVSWAGFVARPARSVPAQRGAGHARAV